MPTEETARFEKLDLLERKISDAVAVIERLGVRCLTLVQDNDELARRVEELEGHNRDLSDQISELKGADGAVAAGLLDNGKIMSKIDRLIEKFGELQV